MSFLGRDLLQSGSLSFVQSRETTQNCRWRLRKSCCLTVNWKCIKREYIINFDLLYQAMVCRHDYATKRMVFGCFCLNFDCAWLWLAEKFFQKRKALSFFAVATRPSCNAICTITTKQTNCRFSSVKGIFTTWQQTLHFLQSKKLEVSYNSKM